MLLILFSFQYVVVPTRRSTAEALQILVSHALGDAGSPYLIGIVSVFFKRETITVSREPIAISMQRTNFSKASLNERTRT